MVSINIETIAIIAEIELKSVSAVGVTKDQFSYDPYDQSLKSDFHIMIASIAFIDPSDFLETIW